jgi:hypothetical protein
VSLRRDRERGAAGVWCYPFRSVSPRVLGHRSVLAHSEQIADSVLVVTIGSDIAD